MFNLNEEGLRELEHRIQVQHQEQQAVLSTRLATLYHRPKSTSSTYNGPVRDFLLWNNTILPSGMARYSTERINADKLISFCSGLVGRVAKRRGRRKAGAGVQLLEETTSVSTLQNTINALMDLWKKEHSV
jgi:hypothetical protein